MPFEILRAGDAMGYVRGKIQKWTAASGCTHTSLWICTEWEDGQMVRLYFFGKLVWTRQLKGDLL